MPIYPNPRDIPGPRGPTGPAGPPGPGGGGATLNVTQASHGFSVGDAIYFNGTLWLKAQANSANTLGLGIVSAVGGINSFTVQFSGPITGLAGLTSGQYYFVSAVTAGALTTVEPVAIGLYSNPLLFATSTTTGVVLPFRPSTNAGSGAGPRNPIDANTLLAYYCNETSGSTLVNYGSTANANLTAQGTYVLGDKGLFFHGTDAIRWPAPGNTNTYPGTTDGAYSTSPLSLSFAAGATIETVVTAEDVPGQFGGVAFSVVDSQSNPQNGLYVAGSYVLGKVQAVVILGGSYFSVDYAIGSPNIHLFTPRMHLAGVFTVSGGGNSLGLWINGVQVGTTAVPGIPSNAANVQVANQKTTPWRGLIAEARFSNVARGQAYLLSATRYADGL
jgi:hypothetical protein